MFKRIAFVTFFVVLGGCALLVYWQPVALKTTLFNDAAQELSESIPYDVHIGRVSGNLWTGFSLKEVRLFKKRTSLKVLEVQEMKVSLKWSALLFHKEVQLDHLEIHFEQGIAELQGQWRLKPVPAGQFVIQDRDFPLDKLFPVAGVSV